MIDGECIEPSLPQNVIDGLVGTTFGAVATSVAIGTIQSIATGSSALGMFALLNQIQLMLSLLILNIKLPQELVYYLTELKFVSFDFSFLQNVKIPYIETEFLPNIEVRNEIQGMDSLGNESGSVLVNEFQFFKTIIIFIILNLICLPLILMSLRKFENY